MNCLKNSQWGTPEKVNCYFIENGSFGNEVCKYEETSCYSRNEKHCISQGIQSVVERSCVMYKHISIQVPGCVKINKDNITKTTCFCNTNQCNRNCTAVNCKTEHVSTANTENPTASSKAPIHVEHCQADCKSGEQELETTKIHDEKTTMTPTTQKITIETEKNEITKEVYPYRTAITKSECDIPIFHLGITLQVGLVGILISILV